MTKNDKNISAQIFHFDLYGKREDKYDFLNENSLSTINWNNLKPEAPNFFFVNKDFEGKEEYEKGFKVDELFKLFGPGVETGLDRIFVSNSKKELIQNFEKISYKSDEIFKILEIKNKASFLVKDKLILENYSNIEKYIVSYQYKIFDLKYVAYFKNSLRRADFNVFKNTKQDNCFLTLMRSSVDTVGFQSVLISKAIIDKNLYSFQTYAFPLYLYPETNGQQSIETTPNPSKGRELERIPNFNMVIVQQIAEKIGLTFTNEKDTSTGSASVSFSPIDILDYIYAVLHSRTYREKYKEFLKIDFPRVPYPKDAVTFWQLVNLGGEIRQIHLLESPVVENYITQYPIDGDNVVSKPKYIPIPKNDETGVLQGNVFINDTQYFANVPLTAWKFYIGGYQPAQKWLKDRKDRKLEFEDILHYQKIIVALSETDKLMKEVDKIEIE